MTKEQLRNQVQFMREEEADNVESEKGEKMTKEQLRNQVQREKRKQEMVDIGGGRMVTKAQLQSEKQKQRNKRCDLKTIHKPTAWLLAEGKVFDRRERKKFWMG